MLFPERSWNPRVSATVNMKDSRAILRPYSGFFTLIISWSDLLVTEPKTEGGIVEGILGASA